jgi:hypothetical protein
MANKKTSLTKKLILAGVGAAAAAGGIAAAVALSDEKNRKKVKKIAEDLKTNADEVMTEIKKLAETAIGKDDKDANSKSSEKKRVVQKQ